MHVTPSSLQVGTLPSAIEPALSKCTTLEKLIVTGLPSSVTAAVLRAVSTFRSLKEVSMDKCDYGMQCVCVVCVCVCVFVCVCVCVCTVCNSASVVCCYACV